MLDDLDVCHFVLAENYLVNLDGALERALPNDQMVSVLSEHQVLSIEGVGQELVEAGPVLGALAVSAQ